MLLLLRRSAHAWSRGFISFARAPHYRRFLIMQKNRCMPSGENGARRGEKATLLKEHSCFQNKFPRFVNCSIRKNFPAGITKAGNLMPGSPFHASFLQQGRLMALARIQLTGTT